MQIDQSVITELSRRVARPQLQQQIDASAIRIALINPRLGFEGARQAIEDLLVDNLAAYFVEPSEAAQQPTVPAPHPLNRHERRRLASVTRKHR